MFTIVNNACNHLFDFIISAVQYFTSPSCLQTKLRLQIQAIDNDVNLDPVERSKRKQNLLLLHNLNIGSPLGAAYLATLESSPTTPSSTVSSLMSPHAQSFYPPGDTVESVIGKSRVRGITIGPLFLFGPLWSHLLLMVSHMFVTRVFSSFVFRVVLL